MKNFEVTVQGVKVHCDMTTAAADGLIGRLTQEDLRTLGGIGAEIILLRSEGCTCRIVDGEVELLSMPPAKPRTPEEDALVAAACTEYLRIHNPEALERLERKHRERIAEVAG